MARQKNDVLKNNTYRQKRRKLPEHMQKMSVFENTVFLAGTEEGEAIQPPLPFALYAARSTISAMAQINVALSPGVFSCQ